MSVGDELSVRRRQKAETVISQLPTCAKKPGCGSGLTHGPVRHACWRATSVIDVQSNDPPTLW